MQKVRDIVKSSTAALNEKLTRLLSVDPTELRDVYVRFLQMQYHLTNGVQRHFFIAASHPDLAKRAALRQFLVKFGDEEELHYKIAEKDLENLGATTGEPPLDAQLWWLYFNSKVHDRPFIRLGATCVLENIASGSSGVLDKLLPGQPFITAKTTRFLTIHRHGIELPHGDQIFEALEAGDLTDAHHQDLILGAKVGSAIYLRMIDWVTGAQANIA